MTMDEQTNDRTGEALLRVATEFLQDNPSDKSNPLLGTTIVINQTGELLRYDHPEDIPKNGQYIAHQWDGWLYGFDVQSPEEIAAWYRQLFNQKPPRNLDPDQISLICWYGLCKSASIPRKRRKLKVKGGRRGIVRTFCYLPDGDFSTLTPIQVRVVKVLQRACSGRGRISEKSLVRAFEANQEFLSTRNKSPYMLFTAFAAKLKRAGFLKVIKNRGVVE